jgi:hypothetical protein
VEAIVGAHNKPSRQVAVATISDAPKEVTDKLSGLPAFQYLRRVGPDVEHSLSHQKPEWDKSHKFANDFKANFRLWRSLGESNPCFSLERAKSIDLMIIAKRVQRLQTLSHLSPAP